MAGVVRLTTKQACQRWGVAPRTLRTWIAKRAVEVERAPSGRPRILVREEDEDERGRPPSPK